jgi:hypothetical protein
MPWAYFQNQAAWDAYHNAVCAAQSIPRPGRIQRTGGPAILSQWTDAWADPIQVKGTGNVTAWVAHVPDADLVTYNLTLSVPDDAVIVDQAAQTVTFTFNNRTYTFQPAAGFNWRKAKPPTYTIDGHVYDTSTGQIIG